MDIDSKAVYKAIEASINNAKESQRILHDDITSVRAYNVAIHHLQWVKGEIDNLVEVAATSDQAQVRRDALLEAAKLVCLHCQHGVPIALRNGDDVTSPAFEHKATHNSGKSYWEFCWAGEIHKKLAADQGQGGERS